MRFSLIIGILGLFMAITIGTEASANKLTCASDNHNFSRCSLPGANDLYVEMIHQLSHSPCERGYTWGADSDGIWVDQGCRAIFKFSGAEPRPPSGEEGCPHGLKGNECAYFKDGFEAGRQDGVASMSSVYERYSDQYDTRFEPYFARGYEEGWMKYR